MICVVLNKLFKVWENYTDVLTETEDVGHSLYYKVGVWKINKNRGFS